MHWGLFILLNFLLLLFFGVGESRLFVERFPVGSAVCKVLPGMSKEQLALCYRNPDVIMAAVEGIHMAVDECKFQLKDNRWNCSTMETKNKNPHSSIILQRGYPVSAFFKAIASAGVASSVARACSSGQLSDCSCARQRHRGGSSGRRRSGRGGWKWSGCSDNLRYGLDFSRRFLDARERNALDIQSSINLHNNKAGRLAVENNKQVKCKCHGVSGSCEIKTCWVTAPEFRVVGDELKTKFQNAILVDQSNLGNGATQLIEETNAGRNRRAKRPGVGPAGRGRKKQRRSGSERNLDNSLLYYEKSPTFCEKDPSIDSPGTEGRQCNLTSKGHDSCASLCCGRGYTSVKKLKKERCNCKFQWCCTVSCETCLKTEWITVCQ
ncbi:protein Wnt-10a [Bemisia tabaci]|uniref:protein Wnt-10a n=1 Tax=Bemisia tabaci TaxID=7038 RepID=UPI0008F9E2CD|nr:PREDICTED: protein Wnt-10a-like [Bemisia tabaci]